MMYIPKQFSVDDERKLRSLIAHNAFATVLSFPEGEAPFINHFPVIFNSAPGDEKTLIGHMARRNPQWMHFRANPKCTAVINGPHTYITPRWYKSGRDVPTWNYAVAHIHGRIELMETFADQVAVLRQLTGFFEKSNSVPWEFELPDDLLNPDALTSAIISFKIHIENVEMKFKFSQNRSREDREGMIEGLKERTDDESRSVREIMLSLEAERGV